MRFVKCNSVNNTICMHIQQQWVVPPNQRTVHVWGVTRSGLEAEETTLGSDEGATGIPWWISHRTFTHAQLFEMTNLSLHMTRHILYAYVFLVYTCVSVITNKLTVHGCALFHMLLLTWSTPVDSSTEEHPIATNTAWERERDKPHTTWREMGRDRITKFHTLLHHCYHPLPHCCQLLLGWEWVPRVARFYRHSCNWHPRLAELCSYNCPQFHDSRIHLRCICCNVAEEISNYMPVISNY